MSAIATAIVSSAIIGGYGSNKAANTQADAQNNASDMQKGMFDAITKQEQPFLNAGYGATSKLSDMMGLSGNTTSPGYGSLTQTFNPTQEQLDKYPGYQFALKTGGQAVQNASTPGAGALSGQTLKSLMNFNQGAANTNYGTYFNQFQQQQQNIFDRLSAIAGLGQNAASNTGVAGTALGKGAAQATSAAGASQAAGTVGVANSIGGASVPLAYLMNNPSSPGSSVSNGALLSANMSSDPLGSLIDSQGWSPSDARLKKNIIRIGTSARGNALYLWDWKTGGSSQGVIAQDVMHIPGAVRENEDGFLMVDYSKV